MMLNIRRWMLAGTPIRNCVYYGTRVRSSRSLPKNGGRQKKKPQFRQDMMFGVNPGVNKQISALGLTEQDLKDPDVLEDMEKQFWNVDKVQDIVDHEDHIQKEMLGIFQVTRKQFKEEKLPNMLLWEEKQEMKSLHLQDPEKWTVMRLAFSYPATPTVVKKVLRSNWKLKTGEEIERHDIRVKRNWDALLKHKLHVPDEALKKHLMSFSDRSNIRLSNSKEVTSLAMKEFNPTKDILKDGGVFANIYRSYKNLKQTSLENDSDKKNADTKSGLEQQKDNSVEAGLRELHYPPKNDTFLIPKSVQNVKLRTSEPLTLEEMKGLVLQDAMRGSKLGNDEKSFVREHLQKQTEGNQYIELRDPVGVTPREDHHENPISDSNKPDALLVNNVAETVGDAFSKNAEKFIDLSKISDHENEENREIHASIKTAKIERNREGSEAIVEAAKSYVMKSSESYPLEITIPKDVWKKGSLYQVKDRFYTDDGEFLFRVPGLIKE